MKIRPIYQTLSNIIFSIIITHSLIYDSTINLVKWLLLQKSGVGVQGVDTTSIMYTDMYAWYL
jgi:hypothetical protein